MDKRIEYAVYGAVIFASFFAGAFLLKSSGIATANFINLADLQPLLAFAFSANSIMLLFIFPLPIAIISMLTHTNGKMEVYLIALGGAIAATILSLVVFGVSFEKIIIGIFFLMSIFVLIELSFIKKDELKKYITFRSASESSKTAFLLLGAGLIIAGASISLANNEQNAKLLGDKIMEVAFNQTTGTDELTIALADSIIKTQKQTVDGIIVGESFQKLTQKNDPDVLAFVAGMNVLSGSINSPQTRALVIARMKKAQSEKLAEQPINFEFLRKQSPIIGMIADNYWLINASSLATLFFFVSNILICNLAGLYAAVMRKFLEKAPAGIEL